VVEKTGIQAKSRVNSTRPAVPACGEDDDAVGGIPRMWANSSLAVTA